MARVESDALLGGRYQLLRPIAAGGMGSVWEAQDAVLHRRVAVKVLSDALAADDRFVERFRREARAAAGLSHPNVAGIFDYGEDGPAKFIVMELIPGETLDERLHRGPPDLDEAVRIARQASAALQAAHNAGIVHRDVKPGNIMLTPDGTVKVMDFGIAAGARDTTLTGSGVALGTAAYISPEQAQGQRATPASDVYALGAVLYEMLTGRPPFQRDSAVALATAHVNDAITPVRQVAPNVPVPVAAACELALAKDPRERPPSPTAFAAMLAEGAATAPVTAGEVTAPLSEGAAATEVLPAATATAAPAGGASGAAPTEVLPSSPPPGLLPARGHRRWAPWALLLILLVLLAGGIALAAIVSRGSHGAAPGPSPPGSIASPAKINVPPLKGLPVLEAEQALTDAGLSVGNIQFVSGPRGIVQDSKPPAGTSLDPGSTVTLEVGSGPKPGPGKHHGHDGKGAGG